MNLEEALEATVVRLRGMILEVADQALQCAYAGVGELLRDGLDSHFGHLSPAPDTNRQGCQARRSLRSLSTRTTFDSIYSSQDMANERKPLDEPMLPVPGQSCTLGHAELGEDTYTVPPAQFTQDSVGLQVAPHSSTKT